MMTHSLTEFFTDWKNESSSTLKIFNALTDASLTQKVTPDGRSLGFLAWHIILTLGEMAGQCGLTVEAPAESKSIPNKASELTAAYKKASASLVSKVQSQWTDAMLNDELDMYGEKWKRGAVLDSIIRHEIHHRAQMTVLMRQAGVKVPGVYGPAREEWAKMGMKPMA
ncbi:MAG: DinB family protein [Bacteroidota bacterium]